MIGIGPNPSLHRPDRTPQPRPAVHSSRSTPRFASGDQDGLQIPDSYAGLVLQHSGTYRAWFGQRGSLRFFAWMASGFAR